MHVDTEAKIAQNNFGLPIWIQSSFEDQAIGRWVTRPFVNKQSVPMNGLFVSLLTVCVLRLRVEVTEEKDTNIVPCKWYSEVTK